MGKKKKKRGSRGSQFVVLAWKYLACRYGLKKKKATSFFTLPVAYPVPYEWRLFVPFASECALLTCGSPSPAARGEPPSTHLPAEELGAVKGSGSQYSLQLSLISHLIFLCGNCRCCSRRVQHPYWKWGLMSLFTDFFLSFPVFWFRKLVFIS